MKVTIIQRRLTHYRVALFENLRSDLFKVGIHLDLIYGQPSEEEEYKSDSDDISWAFKVKNRYFRLPGMVLCWTPTHGLIDDSDLVIITQESGLLGNYFLFVTSVFSKRKIAFWGHGANFQSSNPGGVKERFKRRTTNLVDWWFAYTSLSVRLVQSAGFPSEKITNVENAVDTEKLYEAFNLVKPEDTEGLRTGLGLKQGSTAIFIGSLYENKRLHFLFEAVHKMREHLPNFQVIIIGDGPERTVVEAQCRRNPWCHYVGVKKGYEKALYLSVADIVLNPGGVGLGILDSFVAGVPMVTTKCGLHGPEVSYLRPNKNGLLTENTLEDFVGETLKLLSNDKWYKDVVLTAKADARRYTIKNMTDNFSEGIKKALRI